MGRYKLKGFSDSQKTLAARRWKLIECNGEVSLETSPVNAVLVVGCAFIDACVHLCCWIDLYLRLHGVLADVPLMNLKDGGFSLRNQRQIKLGGLLT